MITSIVVAIDGSSHSSRALSFSARLAATYEAELGVIHVVEPSIFGLPTDLPDIPPAEGVSNSSPELFSNLDSFRLDKFKSISRASRESHRLAMQLAEGIVEDAENNARAKGAERVTGYVGTGVVVDEILRFAASQKADMIVSGHRGMGAIKSLLLGSISTKLSHLAPCTTVIVK